MWNLNHFWDKTGNIGQYGGLFQSNYVHWTCLNLQLIFCFDKKEKIWRRAVAREGLGDTKMNQSRWVRGGWQKYTTLLIYFDLSKTNIVLCIEYKTNAIILRLEELVIREAQEFSYSICTRWWGNKYEHCIFKNQYLHEKWVLKVPCMDIFPFEFFSLAMRVLPGLRCAG